MAANNNVKVGITVTAFTSILVGLLLWVSQYQPKDNSYMLKGKFANVGGLIAGSKVYFLGVKIGSVTGVEIDNDRVNVIMNIESNVKVPKNTKLLIGAKGIVGDKALEFFVDPDAEDKKNTFFKVNDTIEGIPPASFDELIREANITVKKAQNLVFDPELDKNLKGTVKNIELFTRSLNSNIKELNKVTENVGSFSDAAKKFIDNTNDVLTNVSSIVADLKGVASSNKQNVNNIIANAEKISKTLEKTAVSLNTLLENPENQKDLKKTVKDITKTTEEVKKIAASTSKLVDNFNLITNDVRGVSGDSNVQDNLKDIVKNVKTISDGFAKTTSSFQGFEINKNVDPKSRLSLEVKNEIFGKVNYTFGSTASPTFDVVGNFNLYAHTGFESLPFANFGIEELGAANLINIQAGFYPFDNGRFRLGIVRGKLGVGGNYILNSNLLNNGFKTELWADAYDISTPRLRLGVQQNVYNDFGLTLYWDYQLLKNINEFALAVRWQPTLF